MGWVVVADSQMNYKLKNIISMHNYYKLPQQMPIIDFIL